MKWEKKDKEEMTERESEIFFLSVLMGIGIGMVVGMVIFNV